MQIELYIFLVNLINKFQLFNGQRETNGQKFSFTFLGKTEFRIFFKKTVNYFKSS